jgi:hypothetical protein
MVKAVPPPVGPPVEVRPTSVSCEVAERLTKRKTKALSRVIRVPGAKQSENCLPADCRFAKRNPKTRNVRKYVSIRLAMVFIVTK